MRSGQNLRPERFCESVKFGNALECFQEKWIAIFRPETRQNNTLGSGFDSIKTGRTLGCRLLSSTFAGLAISLALVVSGCSSDSDQLDYVERPVETLYNIAVDKLADKNYRESALYFDEVERQHPYSVWARRSMLMSAYSYYRSNKYQEAINAAQRFIALHPGNRDAPYAYYLIAICYYEQISDVGRDQEMTVKALNSLQGIVRRYPQTEYSRDARIKIDMTRDHLAGKEMDVGRYYLTRGQLISAVNRFRTVVENYQTTTHVPEALHRLTETYLTLGLTEEAQTAAAILGFNYPGSRWYQDSYGLLVKRDLQPSEDKRSWISRAWGTVF